MKPSHLALAALLASPLYAEGDSDLAQKLTNPLADLISMPFQGNIDFGIGPGGGHKMFTNIQPVIPISLNDDWNIVSRTILPVIDQQGIDLASDRSDAFGLGDTVQSLFFSPTNPEPFVWGLGPVFLLPTATDTALGSDKWGAGPTGVVFMKSGPWTYGLLANHLWDFAGTSSSGNYITLPDGQVTSTDNSVNLTYIQPFASYTTSTATTFTVNSESTYNWDANQWTIPINFQVSQLVKIGGAPVSVYAGVRWYAEASDQGPDWGARLGFTLMLPKS